jgi:hypothetical protein
MPIPNGGKTNIAVKAQNNEFKYELLLFIESK